MVIKNLVIKNPRKMVVKNFNSDPVGRKYVDIIYGRRGKLGKFLFVKKKRRIKLPKNSKVKVISNNTPKVGFVTIRIKIERR